MKVLNPLLVLEKLKKIKIFTAIEFSRIFNVNYQTAKKAIYRYKKKGIIKEAKKGLYFLVKEPPIEFEIANKLYRPSYISFETALSFYGIIPETTFEIISATSKATRSFIVDNLKFSYKKIKKEYYFGYAPLKIRGRTILIAEPEKALLDLLYFVFLRKREFHYERLNLKKIRKKKFFEYAKIYNKKKFLDFLKDFYDRF